MLLEGGEQVLSLELEVLLCSLILLSFEGNKSGWGTSSIIGSRIGREGLVGVILESFNDKLLSSEISGIELFKGLLGGRDDAFAKDPSFR